MVVHFRLTDDPNTSCYIKQFQRDLFRLAVVDRKPLLAGVVMQRFEYVYIYINQQSTINTKLIKGKVSCTRNSLPFLTINHR